MSKGTRTKVLETGVDAFPTSKSTFLERLTEFLNPTPPSPSSPKARCPKISLPSLVLNDKSKPRARSAALAATSSGPSKCRGSTSQSPNSTIGHEEDQCQLPSSSSTTTSFLESGNRVGSGSLNPLAGPSMQRSRFIHDRAKRLITASEVPSPAPSSKVKSVSITKSRKGRGGSIEKAKIVTGWPWFSCCTKSKSGCDCDNQGQGNLGTEEGAALIKMSSEESLVNITFVDSPILHPVLFKIADDQETVEIEHQHEQSKIIEDRETCSSRKDNMRRRNFELAKADSSSTSGPIATPAHTPVPAPAATSSHLRDRETEFSLAQRLKAMKEKHIAAENSAAHTEENIHSGERLLKGAGGILRGESEIESGFVEVDVPASNIKNPKTLSTIASGSHIRYLGLALQDAIDTQLPKPTEDRIARTLAAGSVNISVASSEGQSVGTTRSNTISPDGTATHNVDHNERSSALPALASDRARSAPLAAPVSSILKPFGQAFKNKTPTQMSNNAESSRSLPIQIKKSSKALNIDESFFKVRPQDCTDTDYPALDSSVTSEDFGFKPTLMTMPGSWPDDSEWTDDRDKFEAVMREKPDTSKNNKKQR